MHAKEGGVNIEDGSVINSLEKDILDHLESKKNALRLAGEAVTTLLQID